MRNEVVAVFGGTGFIGRHLVRRLAQSGAIVRVATRRAGAGMDLEPMGDVGQIVAEPVDLSSDASLGRFVGGAHHVVNLIGILFESRRGDFDRLQGELPGRIGRAAAAAGVRHVVQISAIGADAASPSAYARSKAAGESGLRAAFRAAAILRPSIVFGPEDNFFNQFASMAVTAPALPLIGGGKTRFQPVYVGDVADAVVACLEGTAGDGKTFELGGPRIYSFRELLAYVLETTGRKRPLVGLPFGTAKLLGRVAELLPKPFLTADQVVLLERDNVVAAGALTLADLGVAPTPVEVIVPTYLRRYARYHDDAHPA